MRLSLLSLVALTVNACQCGPTIIEYRYAEARVLVSENDVLVESDTLTFAAAPGQVSKKRFLIVNVGMIGMIIEGVKATSGALVQLDATRLPGTAFEVGSIAGITVEPGDSVELPVTFLPGASGTTQTATLELALDLRNGRKEKRTLTLVGRTFRSDCATISQGADLDLGRLAVGESADGLIVLRNDTNEARTLVISPTGARSNTITLASTNDLVLPPNTTQTLAVRYAPTDARAEEVVFLLKSPDGCADQLLRIRGESVPFGMSFEPSPVDFSAVEPPGFVERTITFRNHTSQPVTLSDLATMAPFSFVGASSVVLPAGARTASGWSDGVLTLTLRFSPRTLGFSPGQLSGRSSLRGQASFVAPLRGLGGTRRLCIDSPLEFGKVPYFAGSSSLATRTLRLRSCGSLPVSLTPPFDVSPANVETGLGELCVGDFDLSTSTCQGTLPPASLMPLPPGAVLSLPVQVRLANPSAAANGLKEWNVAFGSDDTGATTTTVRVTAQPVVVPPCNFSVTPAAVKFATLAPGESAVSVAPVQVCNISPATTADTCLIHSFHVAGAGFSAPSMPGGVVELAPQQCLAFSVHAEATLPEGGKAGVLGFSVSDPIRPRVTIPLSMEVGSTCLAIAPIDFGTVAPGCRAAPRNFGIVNRCARPVVVTNEFLVGGTVAGGTANCPGSTACSLFSLPAPLGTSCSSGSCIAPGYTVAQARFSNLGPPGVSVGWYRLETLEPQQRSYWLRLSGAGAAMAETTDTFGPPPDKADVLLVVDRTQSDQTAFAQNVTSFLSSAESRAVDWQVGVTIAEADSCTSSPCMAGEFLPVPGTQGRIVKSTQPQAAQQLAATIQSVGNRGSSIEKCLEPAIEALSTRLRSGVNAPFLRDDASLGVVCMTRSSEQSAMTTAHATVLLEALTGDSRSGRLSWNVITPVQPAPMGCVAETSSSTLSSHAEAAMALHGVNVDSCSIDWPSALSSVGARAFGVRDTFFLRGTPMSSSGMTVKQRGVPLPATAWRYDAASNAVVITNPAFLPITGAALDVTYPLTCL